MHGNPHTQYRFLRFVSLFLLLIFTVPAFAADGEGESETGFILHHVQDSHQWHFATIGHTHITLPLPIILYSPGQGLEVFSSSNFFDDAHEPVAYRGYKINEHNHIEALEEGRTVYDFSITKNVAALFVSIALLLLVFITMARRYQNNPKAAPKGIQSFFEPIVVFVRDEIAIPSIGKHKYMKFMPYLLTLFFFIWFSNLLGLFPGSSQPNRKHCRNAGVGRTHVHHHQRQWQQRVLETPGTSRSAVAYSDHYDSGRDFRAVYQAFLADDTFVRKYYRGPHRYSKSHCITLSV